MSERLVELEEILRTLRDDGPRSSDAVARELGLHTFDVRLALLDAAIWGLTRRDRRGAWTLTDRGLALVNPDVPTADLDDSKDPHTSNRGRASRARRAVARRRKRSSTRAVRLRRSRWGIRDVSFVAFLVVLVAVVAVTARSSVSHPAATSAVSVSRSAGRTHRRTVVSRQLSSTANHDRTGPGATARQSGASHGAGNGLLGRENAAIDQLLARQPLIISGGPERREVALTFDDAPGPNTSRLLIELERLHAPATFFTTEFEYQWLHASATRELALGDVVGDDTETHPMLALLPEAARQRQILVQAQWLSRHGQGSPRLLRAPYGSYSSSTLRILKRLRMLIVLWTFDTDDHPRPGVALIVRRALTGVSPGSIILMHNRNQTIVALPPIIRGLRARGYELVTVPQLILQDPPPGRQRVPGWLTGDTTRSTSSQRPAPAGGRLDVARPSKAASAPGVSAQPTAAGVVGCTRSCRRDQSRTPRSVSRTGPMRASPTTTRTDPPLISSVQRRSLGNP